MFGNNDNSFNHDGVQIIKGNFIFVLCLEIFNMRLLIRRVEDIYLPFILKSIPRVMLLANQN